MFIVLFGVSGSGKTTVGQLLATDLGWPFYEGDEFHSQGNIAKMHAGIPLTDEDRGPWLRSLRSLIERAVMQQENAVLACSALRKTYRDVLLVNKQVKFVYLRGGFDLIADRLRQRQGHFMRPDLLPSQFATLEEPDVDEDVITIELGLHPGLLADEIKKKLGLL